ncbi:hypothetical protein EDC04DRAFT_2610521 [Pisolithus marmoratus]|nr:hypothetical protein EDC04DRAFT_2610521 [Pisolithus marmoratus]
MTSNTHYGHLLSIPPTLNTSIPKAFCYFWTSYVLHALYGLDSPNSDWEAEGSLQNIPYLAAKCHESVALLVAWCLVCSHYGIGGIGAESNCRNKKIVDKTLAESPYMVLRRESATVTIGDEVLIRVVSTLIYGVGPLPLHSKPPPGGYSTIFFAVAVKKIVQALEEWQEGTFQQLDSSHNLMLSNLFNNVEHKANLYFIKLKADHHQPWVRLNNTIGLSEVGCSSVPGAEKWIPRVLPCLSLGLGPSVLGIAGIWHVSPKWVTALEVMAPSAIPG